MSNSLLKEKTNQWLDYMVRPTLKTFNQNIFSTDQQQIQNPSQAVGSDTYVTGAKVSESPGTAPKSIFEGLQTTVNLARVQANFNPLNPNLDGNYHNFIQFTDNVAAVPFLTLVSSNSSQINQASHDADQLINSFVDGFNGITADNRAQVVNSVQNLVKAALSWTGQTQQQSNFTQNLLRTEADGSVSFHLYYSKFTISQTDNKGTVEFHSEYELLQAEYQLSPESWEGVRSLFENIQKTSTADWLESMNTGSDAGSNVRATCLEGR